MRHLIAQGLKQRKFVKTLSGFAPVRNLGHQMMPQRTLISSGKGEGVGHRKLTHSQLLEKEIEGEGIKNFKKLALNVKKHIKPLKFRI